MLDDNNYKKVFTYYSQIIIIVVKIKNKETMIQSA